MIITFRELQNRTVEYDSSTPRIVATLTGYTVEDTVKEIALPMASFDNMEAAINWLRQF